MQQLVVRRHRRLDHRRAGGLHRAAVLRRAVVLHVQRHGSDDERERSARPDRRDAASQVFARRLQDSAAHRAQNCVGTWASNVFTPCIEIKKGDAAASDIDDYGLESVSGDIMPVEFTLAQLKGVTVNYDLHGGTATVSYTMNWYASTAPTISLSSAAQTAGFTMSAPVGKSDPEGGYTQYTWSVSIPMVGVEASANDAD